MLFFENLRYQYYYKWRQKSLPSISVKQVSYTNDTKSILPIPKEFFEIEPPVEFPIDKNYI